VRSEVLRVDASLIDLTTDEAGESGYQGRDGIVGFWSALMTTLMMVSG
jgi:hypothetical protein